MEIFISWSGPRSKACAEALNGWLPKVINAIQPWISSTDIEKGSRWGQELSLKLAGTQFGIVCLTAENLHSDWILFEAGAISKSVENSRTCTFLVDITPSDVLYPLAQFQHTSASRNDIFELLKTINKAAGASGIGEQHLLEAFDVWWPKLETQLNNLPPDSAHLQRRRSDRDILEEMLNLLRDSSRLTTMPMESLRDRRNRSLVRDIRQRVLTYSPKALIQVRQIGSLDRFSIGLKPGERVRVDIPPDMPYGVAIKQIYEALDAFGYKEPGADIPSKVVDE